jgi:hypothetical protein
MMGSRECMRERQRWVLMDGYARRLSTLNKLVCSFALVGDMVMSASRTLILLFFIIIMWIDKHFFKGI